ncbi:hypothetical protein [Candidatus Laterigemmans baculatus]|uniref:hypothetical protein n=1 Tax=Candidatus Laterigemmans baculatus TaxID=2770505 RepID=UPI0013DC646E|nr:hypothetical protein [Candidatus Laterigemmans baculatus]
MSPPPRPPADSDPPRLPSTDAAANPAEPPEVRTGSPFAVDPPPPVPRAEASRTELEAAASIDVGGAGDAGVPIDAGASVAAEMARGGILAGWLMLPFALTTAWGFPFGGVLIAGLGSVLSLFGCAAPRPRWAIVGLLLHLTLLALAGFRWVR